MSAPGESSRAARTVSFLVRLWHEPREGEGEGPLRGYVRNLRTGAEEYVADPGKLGSELLTQARTAFVEEGEEESESEARAG